VPLDPLEMHVAVPEVGGATGRAAGYHSVARAELDIAQEAAGTRVAASWC